LLAAISLGVLLPTTNEWVSLDRASGSIMGANSKRPRLLTSGRVKAPSNPYILYENEHCCAPGEEGGLH